MSDTVLPTAELTEAIKKSVSVDEIRAAVVAEAEKQQTAATDAAAVTAAATAAEAAKQKALADAAGPTVYKQTVNIGGRDFEFEGSTELELSHAINNAYSVAQALQPAPVAAVVAPEPKGPTQEEKDAAKAELELKFKRGEISASQYIKDSGAMDEYLTSEGISVKDLKSTVTHDQETQFKQSWADATEAFLHTSAGSDWPGGEQNRLLIGNFVAALGLSEAPDKVAALAQAYGEMKKQNLVFPGPAKVAAVPVVPAVTGAAPAIVNATAPLPGMPPMAPRPVVTPATSSGLFDRSSGVLSQPISEAGKTGTPEAKWNIPATATPEEILAEWKSQQLAAGVNLDAAFIEQHRAKR